MAFIFQKPKQQIEPSKTITKAKYGKIWTGRTKEGKLWKLEKHHENSYTIEC